MCIRDRHGGHVHYYERLAPIYQGEIYLDPIFNITNMSMMQSLSDMKAPINIIEGSGGTQHFSDKIPEKLKDYSVFVSNVTGYGELTVVNKTHLLFEQKASATGEVIDHFYISKLLPANAQLKTINHSPRSALSKLCAYSTFHNIFVIIRLF
eukprot:TRINITY_DN3843_c0_g1_i4.p3 TRINITY_DN3843_c0_g1~~TRINITY_DN3843_c0_g1_i4.p3  ORF type:complete len:152 (+),score=16.38 TRINITY_DN3843_c0_g1_i4:66-521(+)